jgi:ABC-type branched-subunit amino acid transport system substrate-binding protein
VRKLCSIAITCMIVAVAAGAIAGPAGAQSNGKKTLYVISSFQIPGESTIAVPFPENAAQIAIADLEKQGWDVRYERIAGSATSAAAEEQAFLTAQGKNPDFWMGLGSSNVFIPIGPKVAQSGIPTFAYSSPTEGVKDGPAGGENIYTLRPLNEEVYARITDYACGTLKLKRIGLALVNTAFGPTAKQAVDRTITKYPKCEVVTVQTNSATATDTTQQVQAFKNADVDGIISANFPNPMGVMINQMRQNGLDVPYIAGSSLSIAKDAGSITTGTQNLYVADDCVPDLKLNAAAKRFTKLYEAKYNAAPNYQAAQVWDAFQMAADAIEKAGAHDPAKINRAMATANYKGICDYATDKNNALARAVYIYDYKENGSKKLLKTLPLPFLAPEGLATSAPPAGA